MTSIADREHATPADFVDLFEPIAINSMQLKNRIVMPPMFTEFASATGEMTERLIQYHVERAKGGVGLIIVENTCIDWETGRALGNPIRLDDDIYIPGWHDLAVAVHRYGAKIASQVHHAGRQRTVGPRQPVAPSPIPCKVCGTVPRALTGDEIEKVIQQYVEAAVRTKRAGLDAVQIHGAHGYLLTSFTSAYTNRRTDRFGGTLDNRLFVPLEIVRRMRVVLGPDFPIIYRLSAIDGMEGGLTLDDTLYFARRLEEAGVDCIDVSAGTYETSQWIFSMAGQVVGMNVPFAEAIKRVVKVPVAAIGRLGSHPEVANQILREGKADLVNFGRSLLADPYLPNKLKEGHPEDIRPCLACGECSEHQDRLLRVACAVNPRLGHEWEPGVEKAGKVKRVVVVGAGPAGMEAACVAAERGHQVTLVERSSRIGGQVVEAGAPWFKEYMPKLVDFYHTCLRKACVDLRLNAPATKQTLMLLQPDVVIVAAGATETRPPIPGGGGSNCFMALEVLAGNTEGVGQTVVIVGGGEVGLETALFLAHGGRKAIVLEMLGYVGGDVNSQYRAYLARLLDDYGVEVRTNHEVKEITPRGVVARDNSTEGPPTPISADSVVTATGFRPNTDVYEELRDSAAEVYNIGSSVKVGRIMEAVSDAQFVAMRI